VHVKHVSCVTFYHLSNRYLSNIMKIHANISTMPSINSTFHSFTVLGKLKALQLSKVGLLTIKHQHSKISQHVQKPLEPKTHKNANCLHEFVHKVCSECPPFAWRRLLTGQLQCRDHKWVNFYAVFFLEIYRSLWHWKNFANLLRTDKVITMVLVRVPSIFLKHSVNVHFD